MCMNVVAGSSFRNPPSKGLGPIMTRRVSPVNVRSSTCGESDEEADGAAL